MEEDEYCIIEPIKQKIFEFGSNGSQIILPYSSRVCFMRDKISHQSIIELEEPPCFTVSHEITEQKKEHSWRPVIQHKKLYEEPKIIMSLERKKARIIAAIRDRQVNERKIEKVGMSGSKIRNNDKIISPSKRTLREGIDIDLLKLMENNSTSFHRTELKKIKNPNMNFSLNYIKDRKKGLLLEKEESQICSETKITDRRSKSARFSQFTRHKGSDSPYLHMLLTEGKNTPSKTRPVTAYSRGNSRN